MAQGGSPLPATDGVNEYFEVVTTVARQQEAEQLARHVVEQRLAACVQIVGPVRSIYRWQGRIESDEEWLCLMKTTAARYAALEASIRARHPYDVPQILALQVATGSEDYLAWLREQVAPGEP